ncbi:unnamed protein product [Rhizophagus irregularis]|nr:unnamed protein product [Rhizophagus irregularis]
MQIKLNRRYEEDYLNSHVACSGCKADEDREQFDTTNKRGLGAINAIVRGPISPVKGVPGRRKLFSRSKMCILQNLVKDKVDWYLDELVYEMENLTGKRVSVSAL